MFIGQEQTELGRKMKIKKVLIANRAEIAIRVAQTCRLMGIESVGIFSETDRGMPHTKAVDEIYGLGLGSLAQTYLNEEKIIAIAKEAGVDAIHPGYGFLSERASFSKKVNDAGLIFIGPSEQVIELMGDKKESKIKMQELGIPLVPGFHGKDQSEETLLKEAEKIGFPLLIKASAGGGGKGMRIVEEGQSFVQELQAAKREALNAFGNDTVLLEKYIVNPRHIEVQLVSDGVGNHFHFYERECSIQRRYQKIIEETPSCALDKKLRQQICETAVKIASGIDYRGAGTIEFILAPDKSFYFLEMNTRLQVEHPVTEMVTGHDLVKLQILAAAGEEFPFAQDDIKQEGHSLEMRIYAEDPDNEFLPSIGQIHHVGRTSQEGVRLDSGFEDQNFVSIDFDPMLAKLIVHSQERKCSIEKALLALDDYPFAGIKTNRDYLKRILTHSVFRSGEIHTHFIKDHASELKPQLLTPVQQSMIIACALVHQEERRPLPQNVWSELRSQFKKSASINGNDIEVEVLCLAKACVSLKHNGIRYDFEFAGNGVSFQGRSFSYHVSSNLNQAFDHVFIDGIEAIVRLKEKALKASSLRAGAGSLQSPMPGKIFKILKAQGEQVKAGEPILILEAMKMEHTIKAQQDGVVKHIHFAQGEQVQGGVELCEIEALES